MGQRIRHDAQARTLRRLRSEARAARGEALGKLYVDQHYHQPSDKWSPEWDFSGMADDVALLHALGRDLANSRAWPEWSVDSEFKAVRDQTPGERSRDGQTTPREGERGR